MRERMIAVLTLALLLTGCGSASEAGTSADDGTMVAITERVTQAQTTVSDVPDETTAETGKVTERQTEASKKVSTAAKEETDGEETVTDARAALLEQLISAEYRGVYAETEAKKATIELVPDLDGTYSVLVNWTNSAADTFAWTFEGTFEDGKLEYDNAIKTHIVFDENDKSTTETEYSGGKGFIEVKNDVLTWNDEEEQVADGLRFKLVK